MLTSSFEGYIDEVIIGYPSLPPALVFKACLDENFGIKTYDSLKYKEGTLSFNSSNYFGDILNDVFGSHNSPFNNEFAITAWIKPTKLNAIESTHGTTNTFISKSSDERIPNSKVEILPGLDHGLTIEAPEKVNNVIWNFIRENL